MAKLKIHVVSSEIVPIYLKVYGTPPLFPPCFQRETIFLTVCSLTLRTKSSQMGSTLKGKDLFQPIGAYSSFVRRLQLM